MNLSKSLAVLRDYVQNVERRDLAESKSVITEAKGHLDHPEDLVFLGGIDGARKAIAAVLETAQKPNEITIKFDGYPALIFGRGTDGKFSIMDKHMFNRKEGAGRHVYSPEQFRQYDAARGADRGDLYNIINTVWSGLEAASANLDGYIWGDLLFSRELLPEDGLYRFRANPNGITYTVDARSEIGRLIAEKDAGIAVHQYISPGASSTDQAVSLHGSIGPLKNTGNVAIVPSKLPVTPEVKVDRRLIDAANKQISKYGNSVSDMLANPPINRASFEQLFTVYINKRIVAGDLHDLLPGFVEFYQTRPMSNNATLKLDEYFGQHRAGLAGIFHLWAAIYALKMSVVEQLNKAAADSPVKGYLEDGTQTQEGFVSQGLKFVDRMGFSRQNLAGR